MSSSLLFTPYEFGPDSPSGVPGVSLKNRVIMGSIHTGLEEVSRGYDRLAAFYAERAKGGVGLIITGGVSPNFQGRVSPWAVQLSHRFQIRHHKKITKAAHDHGAKIAMQLLHAGRYAYHPFCVAPSAIKSPISPFKPFALGSFGIRKTIRDFVNSAVLAEAAGYDGVEVMGSEGYLIHQFIAQRTNKRTDRYGGSLENRMRLPLEIVSGIRARVKKDFLIIFRLSLLDLVEGGSTREEIHEQAKMLEKAGVQIINTGIGWHEARIPTIATVVPRAAFTRTTAELKTHVKIPVCATNRINMPEVAQGILERGEADFVCMARPFLADAEWVNKAKAGKSGAINTCIACNQACLDHTFQSKVSSCLVNPRACHETEIKLLKANVKKKIAVVGAGPAGLAFATAAATRGHEVVLFEGTSEIGGQFGLAQKIPGKEEFTETIRFYKNEIERLGITLQLGKRFDLESLKSELKTGGFQEVVLSTGVKARRLGIEGIENSKVLTYSQAVLEPARVGKRVAIIGAGGIGFDVAALLAASAPTSTDPNAFYKHWGIDPTLKARSGIEGVRPHVTDSERHVYLLQRTPGRMGSRLGKTTGWIHRAELKNHKVEQRSGVEYHRIDDRGLHGLWNGSPMTLEVDTIVICAGQESERSLYDGLKSDLRSDLKSDQKIEMTSQTQEELKGIGIHLIGGAKISSEIDAKRAIDEGVRLADRI